MGSLAHTGILGYCEQRICMCLFNRRGVFQLLADATAGHCRKYELRGLGDGGNCHLQPGLLSGMGEESIQGTRGRGHLKR